jgi:CO dehydrogenase maturation factor
MSGLGFTIAVSGKGGVGKTMLSSLLIRNLCARGSTLAIDADPDSNLPYSLGVRVKSDVGMPWTRSRGLRWPCTR